VSHTPRKGQQISLMDTVNDEYVLKPARTSSSAQYECTMIGQFLMQIADTKQNNRQTR
jgi:hypothetical protein